MSEYSPSACEKMKSMRPALTHTHTHTDSTSSVKFSAILSSPFPDNKREEGHLKPDKGDFLLQTGRGSEGERREGSWERTSNSGINPDQCVASLQGHCTIVETCVLVVFPTVFIKVCSFFLWMSS